MGLKYKVNENFFTHWNKEMSYVLGYLYADGSMEDAGYIRGKYVRVSSIDKVMIQKIRKTLLSEHTVTKTTPVRGKDTYLLRIGNKKLYNSLLVLGLYPHKSKSILMPDVPKEYLSDFVRGYFDGDGCVYIEKYLLKNGKIGVKRLSVVFTSGSIDFLEKLCHTLREEVFLSQEKIYRSHRSFQLRYSTKDSLKLYDFFYQDKRNLFMKRKYDVFQKYLKYRGKQEGLVAKW